MKNQHGFTIVELIVTMSIMAILASMVVINFRANEIENLLDQEAQRYVTVVRQAQNYALTGQKFEDQVPKAYGLYIGADNKQMILYADLDEDATFDGNEEVQRYILDDRLEFFIINVNFLFLSYKTVDGFCWDDYTACGGDVETIISVIQKEDDVSQSRTIRYDRRSGQVKIL
jgi:prepilin-type N-terminal cleavage/methylation domain-containing protein